MVTIRPLERSDAAEVTRLSTEAFGEYEQPDPPVNPLDRPGRHLWCAADGDRLSALVADREFSSWIGGAEVPTSGIASVAVEPEARGRGLLTPLFDRVLAGARERGALVSSLFPTSPGIYRRFGYAPIASLDHASLPTGALAVRGDTLPVRRADAGDLPGIHAVYTRWASRHNGLLTRTGPSFTPDDPLVGVSGVTVVESSPGTISGYVSWNRGTGYGDEATIRVPDLVADDPVSLASLMNSLASHASVAGTTVIRTSGIAEWQHLLRSAAARVVESHTYMLAVLDVAVLEQLTYPEGLDLVLPFSWGGRGHVLTVDAQRGHVEAADVGDARALDAASLALTITGAERSSGLRRLGHLTGDASADVFWDALFGIRQPHVLDYF